LATLEHAITEARLGTSRTFVIAGEPGIGKSALLEHAIQMGRNAGMEVLGARGVESEAEVPFAGLLELLRPALEQLERIPAPQAGALRSAFDLGPTVEGDRFVIGAATLNLLSARSERSPLLLAVDDAHWLDDSSLAAIVFAARRLLVDPVAVIFAARTGELRSLEQARLPQLALSGVDSDAAAAIVARHAPAPPIPGLSERLLRASGGNPLALIELAATASEIEPGPVEARTSVSAGYERRVAELPRGARQILALAAAEETGSVTVIEAAASDLGLRLADLEHAEHAGFISIAYGVLSWRHPLLRAAAYHVVSAGDRRAMHAALALALPTAEGDRRAWHRAAAALGPDEEVAEELEQAGRRARSRSAYAEAATASERAAQLTPADGPRATRLLAAAEAAWLGGHAERTLAMLAGVLALSPEPHVLADVQHLRGHALIRSGKVLAGRDVLTAAAAEIERDDPGKAVVMLSEAAEACFYAGLPDAMLPLARRAGELVAPGAESRERFFASLALGTALIFSGEGNEGVPWLHEAVALIEDSDALSGETRLLSAAAVAPLWLREAQTGEALVDRAIEMARREGALGALPFSLGLAARYAATADRLAVGEALYEEAIDLARETEQAMPLCGALAGLASIKARKGDSDACKQAADDALALSAHHGLGLFRIWALDALAELELGLGRLDDAVEHLEAKRLTLRELGITDPDLSPVPELTEASVRGATVDGLEAMLDDFAKAAAAKGQPWALARVARSRALLSNGSECEGYFEEALTLDERTPDRFELSRTRLCYGEYLRRAGQRVRAREQLRPAVEAFDELGAAPWAERANAELLATGERARRRDPSTLDDLTPQELRIGMVLAGGATTKEAAAMLFLSPKTVEYHLRNTYRKLGIHSRDELAQELSRLGVSGETAGVGGAVAQD
jgi:DNA-binding CsgD family transcriptional regulator